MVASLLLFGIGVLCFHPVLTGRFVFIERDLSGYFLPPKYYWVNLIRSGEFPFWNPHNYNGMPFLATLQPGILYPPNLLLFILPFPIAWNWLIIGHFIFAGCSLYVLLRFMKVSKTGAFIGAVIFMLSGYLLSVHSLLTHLLAIPWVPLTILSYVKHLETKKVKGLIYTVLFLSLQFLAGAPEIVMMSLLILFIITIGRWREHAPASDDCGDKSAGKSATRVGILLTQVLRMRTLLVVTGLFLLFVLPQLLTFLELKQYSIRHVGLSYREATIWSMSWKDFVLFYLPDSFGYFQNDAKYWANQSWLKTIYLGFIPFILSAFYLMNKDKRRPLLLAVALLSLLLALGDNTPFYQLLYKIPPFNSIRYPVKFLAMFFLVVAVMAGFGYDRMKAGLLINDTRTGRIAKSVFYGGFFCAILWGLTYFFEREIVHFLDIKGIKPDAYNDIAFNMHNLRRLLLFFFVFSIALQVARGTRFKKAGLFVALVVLMTDLFLANYGFYSRVDWDTYIKRDGFVDVLSTNSQTERYFVTAKTSKTFNHYPLDRAIFSAAYTQLFGGYAVEGMEVMKTHFHDTITVMMKNTNTIKEAGRYLDILGVRFLTTSYEMDNDGFRKLAKLPVGKEYVYLYEYKGYPGRFPLYGKAMIVGDDRKAIDAILDRKNNLREILILKGKKEEIVDYGVPKGSAKLVTYGANTVVFDITTDRKSFFYLGDTWYPGWQAYIDGKETKIYRANLAYRAIEVPSGTHRVKFRFIPRSFYIGLGGTVIGALICIILVRRERKKDDTRN